MGPTTGCLPHSGRDRGEVLLGTSLWSDFERCDRMGISLVMEWCSRIGMWLLVGRHSRHRWHPPFPRLRRPHRPHLRMVLVVVGEAPLRRLTRASRGVSRVRSSDPRCIAPSIACIRWRPALGQLDSNIHCTSANSIG